MTDAFDILGLPPQFALARAEIDRAYRKRVAAMHPDLAMGADPEAGAARLNEAREVLLDAERRAAALLARLGGPGPEDRALPLGFLGRIMERRETIEEALTSDPGAARQELDRALADRGSYIELLTPMFERAQGSPDPGLLAEIRRQLNAWRYIERLIEQLSPAAI